MFTLSKQFSKQANMKYTYIPLCVSAAINVYYVQSNQTERWSKIAMHLGYFHGFFFGVPESYMSGRRFEETLYEFGMCQPVAMSTVMSGKRYNRCWILHGAFAKAIQRQFLQKYAPFKELKSVYY